MRTNTLYRYRDFLKESSEETESLVRQVTANAIWDIIDKDTDFAIFLLYDTRTRAWLEPQQIDSIDKLLSRLGISFTLFEVRVTSGAYPDQSDNSNRYFFVKDVAQGQAKHLAERCNLDRIIIGNKSGAHSIDLVGDRTEISLDKGDMGMAWAGALLGPSKPWV